MFVAVADCRLAPYHIDQDSTRVFHVRVFDVSKIPNHPRYVLAWPTPEDAQAGFDHLLGHRGDADLWEIVEITKPSGD